MRSIHLKTLSLCGTILPAVLACGPQPAAETATETETAAEIAETSGDAHEGEDALPLPKRLAFMAGHVEAGLALYRAGEPEMAAPHLLHPVSETHAAEREGLDALGFDGSIFEQVSTALEEGVSAADVEPQLEAAEAHLAILAASAGGEPREIIAYLLDTVAEEYAIGVPEATVTDPGEYQDAYGFTVVAIARTGGLGGPGVDELRAELEGLLELWPGGPVPPEDPTPLDEIERQVERVRAALAATG